jgi:L-lactate dehydrogenase complex protein LldF
VLSPQLTGVKDNKTLPFASTLCGACFDACPVRIDIPSMLVHLRARAVRAKGLTAQRAAFATVAWTMRSPRRFGAALRLSRLGRVLGRSRDRISWLPWPLSRWTSTRDLPRPPRRSLRRWWSSR